MKVLITGGCGFVGINLIEYLAGNSSSIRVLDNLSSGKKEYLEALAIDMSPELIIGDIRDKEQVDKALEGIDAVVHLAAQTSVMESIEKPQEAWDINTTATFEILESCHQKGIQRFIFASSNAVVGEQIPPIDESKIPCPLSPYGASKLAGENLCSAYYHSYGMKTIALRFANLYGPYSHHKTSVISNFMQIIEKDKPFMIYGDGNQTRDFVHVTDVCQAISLALQTPDHHGEIFQIASGVETSLNELVDIFREITGKQLQTRYEPQRKGEIRRNFSDIGKARDLLGFKPAINLKDGLKALL